MTFWENYYLEKCISDALKIPAVEMGRGHVRVSATDLLIRLIQNKILSKCIIDENFLRDMETVEIQNGKL